MSSFNIDLNDPDDPNNPYDGDEETSILSDANMKNLLNGYYTPTTDIKETSDYIIVEVELPGVSSSNINIEIGDGVLDIRGEHVQKSDHLSHLLHRSQKLRYIQKERICGKFKKSIPVSKSIGSSQVHASFNEGLLCIELTKTKKNNNTKKQKIRLV